MTPKKTAIDFAIIKRKLVFANRPVCEFCGACVTYLERFYNRPDVNLQKILTSQNFYMDVMEAIDASLSKFIKNELTEFGFVNIIATVVKGFIFDYYEINTFDDFLKSYDKYTDEQLYNFIGGCFINEQSKSNCDDWGSVCDNMTKMVEYIEKIEDCDKEKKEKILELYKNPKETKMRLRYVIVSIYEAFKPYENTAVAQAKKQQQRYSNILEIDPDYFSNILLLDEILYAFENCTKLYLNISYMYPVAYFCKVYNNKTAFLLNGYLCDEVYAAKHDKGKVLDFLKIFSDENRAKMIFLYAQKEYYVQEVARELNILPADVRAHNQELANLGLLNYEQAGKRRYYYLNKTVMAKYLNLMRNDLRI